MADEKKTAAIAKANSWELGIVKPTKNGGRCLLLNDDVEVTVGGRLVEGGIFFDMSENVIAFQEKLVSEKKASADSLIILNKRVANSGATQFVRGRFQGSN